MTQSAPQWDDRRFAADVASLCSEYAGFNGRIQQAGYLTSEALRVEANQLQLKFRELRRVAHRYVGTSEPEIPAPGFECPTDERIESAARAMYEHFANRPDAPPALWHELQPSMQRIYLNRVRFLAQEGYIR